MLAKIDTLACYMLNHIIVLKMGVLLHFFSLTT